MNIADFQKVLTIVSKYVDPQAEWLEASHDVIFLPIHRETKLSTEDKKELNNLGAYLSSDYDCWSVFT